VESEASRISVTSRGPSLLSQRVRSNGWAKASTNKAMIAARRSISSRSFNRQMRLRRGTASRRNCIAPQRTTSWRRRFRRCTRIGTPTSGSPQRKAMFRKLNIFSSNPWRVIRELEVSLTGALLLHPRHPSVKVISQGRTQFFVCGQRTIVASDLATAVAQLI
jgi:hypothetical protein